MASSMNIGKYLTLADCTRSATAKARGISNVPNAEQIASMVLVAQNVFDKVKDKFPNAVVSSFFRSPELNRALKGSRTSQHCKGEAIDIDSRNDDLNDDIFKWVIENIDFDQIIWEKGNKDEPAWVHVSYKSKGNRKQILKIS